MEHFRAAERALVTALVLGDADPLELSGRLRPSDFTDPAAGVIFGVVVESGPGAVGANLPAVLQRKGLLRRDGYPLSHLLEWMARLPVPVHPQAWATLVVAGTVAREVEASGTRLLQSVEVCRERSWPVGQVLAVVAVQRAALSSSRQRWEDLPASWRDTVPSRLDRPWPGGRTVRANDSGASEAIERATADAPSQPVPVHPVAGARERLLVAGVLAGSRILGRIPWLREDDFTDRACGSVFATLRREHESGRDVDVVTLAAVCEPSLEGWAGQSPAELARDLRPEEAMPTAVPFLSRMVLGDAVLRDVEHTGTELIRLAQAPAKAGGLGADLLTAAQERLEALGPHTVRWGAATRPQSTHDLTCSSVLDRSLERSGADRSTSRSLGRSTRMTSTPMPMPMPMPPPVERALDRDVG